MSEPRRKAITVHFRRPSVYLQFVTNLKLSFSLIKNLDNKMFGAVEVNFMHSWRRHKGMCMASFMSRRLYHGHTTTDGQWIEGQVGPRVGMDVFEERKLSCPDPKSEARSPCHPDSNLHATMSAKFVTF